MSFICAIKLLSAIQDLYSDTLGQNLTLMGVTFNGGLNQNSDRNAVPELWVQILDGTKPFVASYKTQKLYD